MKILPDVVCVDGVKYQLCEDGGNQPTNIPEGWELQRDNVKKHTLRQIARFIEEGGGSFETFINDYLGIDYQSDLCKDLLIIHKAISNSPDDTFVFKYFNELFERFGKKLGTQFRHKDWPVDVWVTLEMSVRHELSTVIDSRCYDYVKNWVKSSGDTAYRDEWTTRDKKFIEPTINVISHK